MSQEKLRKIKSFVRRGGRMTQAQEGALNRLWPTYGLSVKQGRLNFSEIFGRNQAVILEIGFGMGESLACQAQQFPENDYLGVEVHRPGVGALFIAMEQEGINNIRVFQEDVNDVLANCIPDESLSGINIFFPDPWPKKRHHKRRLIQPDFVALLWKKLKTGGKLHLATDWEDYARQMMQVLSQDEGFNNLAGHGCFVEAQTLRPTTKFEKRGIRLGHQVWDLLFMAVR